MIIKLLIKLKKFIPIILTLFLFFGCNGKYIVSNIAPNILPNTNIDMRNAEFWISKLDEPDKTIMNLDEIKNFNQKLKFKNDFEKLEDFEKKDNGKILRDDIRKNLDSYKTKKLFDIVQNRKLKNLDFENIYKNSNLEKIEDYIEIKFGFVIRDTSQKVFPYDNQITDFSKNKFFDEFQISNIDIGTPIFVYHESLDKKWIFVKTPLTEGWIQKENVVFCSYEDLISYINSKDFVITIEPKVELLDLNYKYLTYSKMGVKFKIKDIKSFNDNEKFIKILVPFRDENEKYIEKEVFISRKKVNVGYLNYCQRTIIEQSFKFLDTPYGWGGMFGEQDCSQFILEVFRTVGIYLPRNSYWQANAQDNKFIFENKSNDINFQDKRIDILKYAKPGISLFYFPGHIMLYLGNINNEPFIIHSIWRYKTKEISKIVNKVVVSDLLFGNNEKASFLDRLKIISNVEDN